MVLEALINPVKAERKPWESFIIGMIYASIAVLVGHFIFFNMASIMIVSLTAAVSIPLVYGAIKLEERKDMEINDEKSLMAEHGKALMVFIFLFLGFTTAFAFWFTLLPEDISSNLFSSQIDSIKEINGAPSGNFFSGAKDFSIIIMNNLKVLIFCLLFSFFYGFGAIFILTWNASIFAVFIATLIRNSLSINHIPLIIMKYCLHGIPEILAYFIAGLAGGIISIAIIRHDYGTEKFRNILTDSLDLIMISIVILIVAGLLEVYISPFIYNG